MTLSQEDVRSLIDDVAYLQDELEALRYIITSVPYLERPVGSVSIMDMIALLKEQQEHYYRPLIEHLFKDAKGTVPELKKVGQDFQVDENEVEIDHLLNKTIKKRASYVNFLKQIPLADWSRTTGGEKSPSIAELVKEHVQFDRQQLKYVAERVMTLNSERSTPPHH